MLGFLDGGGVLHVWGSGRGWGGSSREPSPLSPQGCSPLTELLPSWFSKRGSLEN